MEDPSEEDWEVDDYSKSYECKGKLGLIWKKGLNVGKKMVITGVVISSAPFVVPPLMALSAIGFALSVPAGFAFATYACSEMLMNKLLPMPSPPPWEENEMVFTSEEEDRFYIGNVDKGYEKNKDNDSEEVEFAKDTRKEVEARLELVDEKIDDDDRTSVNEIVEEDEEKPLCVSGVNEEEMTRETTGLIVEMKDEGIYEQEGWDVLVEETIEEIEGNMNITIKNVTGYDNVCIDDIVAEDEEKPLGLSGADEEEKGRETTGLNEEMRDEGKYDQKDMWDIIGEKTKEESEGKRENSIEGVTDYGGIPIDEIVAEDEEKPLSLSGIDEEEMRRETTGLIEEMRDVGKYDEMDKETMEESERNTETPIKDVTDYGRIPIDEIVTDNEGKPLSVSGVDEEEMRRETTELIEEMRDVGKYDQKDMQDIIGKETTDESEGKSDILIEVVTDYGRIPIDKIVAEDEGNPLSMSGLDEEEMRRETTGLVEEMRDAGKYEQQDRVDIVGEDTTEESDGKREIPIKDIESNKGIKNELFVFPEEVRPDEDAKGVTNGLRSVETVTYLSSVGVNEEDAKEETNNGFRSEEILTNSRSSRPNEEVREEGVKKLVVQVKKSGNFTATNVRLVTSSDEKTGSLVISDEDAREIGNESGLDLFDQLTPSLDQTGDSVNKMSTGVHEVLIETTTLTLSEHSGATSSQDSNTSASGKVKPSEEKIWEHINAMRTIVGYKATRHSSCLEELKALYLFTGVESPPSSGVDLIDIDEKLHFLMSIIGVK